jgi:hypothetical protein
MSSYTRYYEKAIHWANRWAEKNPTDWGSNHAKLWRVQEFLDRVNMPHFGDESVDFEPTNETLDYVNMGDTYTETILCDEDGTLSIGDWGTWLEEKEKSYCEDEGRTRCGHCGEFPKTYKDDWRLTECECGHYVTGDEIPEIGSQLSNCREVADGDYERVWVCDETLSTHGTNPLRQTHLVVRCQYTEEYCSEWAQENGRYCVGLLAVNPGVIGKKEVSSLCSSMGLTEDEWDEADIEAKIAACLGYGTYATLWEKTGDSLSVLLSLVDEELQGAHILGGFMLDKAQNAIGSTGWDFMQGKLGKGFDR